jgi:hypothetical protein
MASLYLSFGLPLGPGHGPFGRLHFRAACNPSGFPPGLGAHRIDACHLLFGYYIAVKCKTSNLNFRLAVSSLFYTCQELKRSEKVKMVLGNVSHRPTNIVTELTLVFFFYTSARFPFPQIAGQGLHRLLKPNAGTSTATTFVSTGADICSFAHLAVFSCAALMSGSSGCSPHAGSSRMIAAAATIDRSA